MEQYQRVYITKDDDGHNYVIPYEMKEEFKALCEKAYAEDDFEDFTEKFGEYATGGDINEEELYQKIK